jgi:hypothetical protein
LNASNAAPVREGDLVAAVDKAAADGVDVVNMSFGGGGCEGYLGNFPSNAHFRAATDAGILFLAAAGNGRSYSSNVCNINHPAYLPTVIGVNGLDTRNVASGYNSLIMADSPGFLASSRGRVPLRTFLGTVGSTAGPDLAAPACQSDLASLGPDQYEPFATLVCGTSIASPITTGIAANMKHAWKAIWNTTDPRILQVVLLVNGDTSNGYQSPSDMRTATSMYTGYGRVRGHFPGDSTMAAPWAWGARSFKIYNGQTVSWPVGDSGPESYSVTQWKWALTWAETSLDGVADIDISVWNTCPPGGTPVQVAGQSDYDIRNRIHLRASEIGGKCLEMRAYGYNVPPEGRVVYSSDYFHSGDPEQH